MTAYTPSTSQDTDSDVWESITESSYPDERSPSRTRGPSSASRTADSRKRRLRPSTRKASSRVTTPTSTPRKRINSLPSSPNGGFYANGQGNGSGNVMYPNIQSTFPVEKERGAYVLDGNGTGTRARDEPRKWEPSETTVMLRNFLNSTMRDLAQISFDALRTILWLIKRPLVYLLIIYTLIAMGGLLYRQAEDAVRVVWCKQPISRWVGVEWCTMRNFAPVDTGEAVNVENLWSVQERLGTVMEKAGEGVGMARGMKSTEHAVRDLVVLVRNSEIAGRDALSEKLEGFVEGAKRTTRDLSRFTAKVSGVVDSIIAMDEFALHTLQALSLPPSFSQRALSILLPFNPSNPNASLLKTFTQITTHMSSKLPPLIMSAEALLSDLDSLEQTLITVNEMVARDSAALGDSERELLSNLWVRLLGARSKDLANFRSHRELLVSVSEYRGKALELVTGTLVELQAIQADLEDFAGRLNEPAFVGDEVPVQVVIEGIRRGVKRLNMGRFEVEGRRRGEWAVQKEISDRQLEH